MAMNTNCCPAAGTSQRAVRDDILESVVFRNELLFAARDTRLPGVCVHVPKVNLWWRNTWKSHIDGERHGLLARSQQLLAVRGDPGVLQGVP